MTKQMILKSLPSGYHEINTPYIGQEATIVSTMQVGDITIADIRMPDGFNIMINTDYLEEVSTLTHDEEVAKLAAALYKLTLPAGLYAPDWEELSGKAVAYWCEKAITLMGEGFGYKGA